MNRKAVEIFLAVGLISSVSISSAYGGEMEGNESTENGGMVEKIEKNTNMPTEQEGGQNITPSDNDGGEGGEDGGMVEKTEDNTTTPMEHEEKQNVTPSDNDGGEGGEG